MLVALARSLSIGAWVGTASAALVIAALRGRRWLLGIALGLVLVAMAAALVLPGERIRSRLDPVSGTGLSRLQIWEASLQMIADHPVLGVGLDNFLYAYRQDYMLTEAWREPNISHPHNWVLHTWLQLGLLGLIATVGLLAWAGWRAASLLRAPTSPLDPTLGAATFAFLTDVLVHGSFDNSYFLVDLAVLWWVLLALLHPSVSHGSPYNSLSAPIPADPR
jgi:O-antigen ligase